MFIDNTMIEEKDEENIEENYNNYKETKEKSFKTNHKVKKSEKK